MYNMITWIIAYIMGFIVMGLFITFSLDGYVSYTMGYLFGTLLCILVDRIIESR